MMSSKDNRIFKHEGEQYLLGPSGKSAVRLPPAPEAVQRTVIGHIYVDSGKVLITDPSRVLEFDEGAGEFPADEGQVIEPTYGGDGIYPVIAELDEDGRAIRLIVELVHDALAD
jgi:hypothetical protein